MTTRTAQLSPQIHARVTGFLYLLLFFFGIFGLRYIPSRLFVPGDAAATTNNILASESLFRLGIAITLIGHVIDIFVVLALYQLLKSVNKNMAGLMVILVLVGVPIAMLDEVNQLAVLLLLNSADYLKVFSLDQLQALVRFFLNLHGQGLVIAEIFWGLWLFPLGYLVFKSGFLPRLLGILLMIGCFGYLIDSFTGFLLPDFTFNILVFTSWGELLLTLWLLIKGVNAEQWEKRALESG